MRRAGISHVRPPHIHFHLTAPGYHPLITQLYQKEGPYLDSDAVFAVKEALIVDFARQPPGKAPNGDRIDTPIYLVSHDFVLQRRRS